MGDIIREIEESGPLGEKILEELGIKEKDKKEVTRKVKNLVGKILDRPDNTTSLR